ETGISERPEVLRNATPFPNKANRQRRRWFHSPPPQRRAAYQAPKREPKPERAVQRNLPDTDIKVLYCFYQNNGGSKCEVAHTSPSLIPNKTRQVWKPGGDTWHRNQNQLGSYLPPGWR